MFSTNGERLGSHSGEANGEGIYYLLFPYFRGIVSTWFSAASTAQRWDRRLLNPSTEACPTFSWHRTILNLTETAQENPKPHRNLQELPYKTTERGWKITPGRSCATRRHSVKIFSEKPPRTQPKSGARVGKNIPQKEGEVETGKLFDVVQHPRTRGRGLKRDS